MPLMPKRTKYRKQQKGRNRGKATRGTKVTNGEYGIQTLEAGLITGNQIEAARIAMTRYIKEYYVAPVKPGRVMFEIAGVPEATAREALRLAMNKLSVKCKFVARESEDKVGDSNED